MNASKVQIKIEKNYFRYFFSFDREEVTITLCLSPIRSSQPIASRAGITSSLSAVHGKKGTKEEEDEKEERKDGYMLKSNYICRAKETMALPARLAHQ